MRGERVPLWMLLFWLLATMGWWAFAFAPASGSPEWFLAARNACFGTLENGLPDTYGWMVLVLAPGSMLLGLLVAWYDELKAGLLGALFAPRGRFTLLVLATLIAAEGWMVGGVIRKGLQVSAMSFRSDETGELPPDYPRTAKAPPEFSLVNQHGHQVRLADLKGKVVLVTFAFAHCQTVCPALVGQALSALRFADTGRYHLLIVTLDPWRDTPRALPSLARKWGLPENAWVLSGPVPEVERVIRAFNVPYERNARTGDVSHPALLFLLDTDGLLAYTFNNAPPAWLREASERLAGKVAMN